MNSFDFQFDPTRPSPIGNDLLKKLGFQSVDELCVFVYTVCISEVRNTGVSQLEPDDLAQNLLIEFWRGVTAVDNWERSSTRKPEDKPPGGFNPTELTPEENRRLLCGYLRTIIRRLISKHIKKQVRRQHLELKAYYLHEATTSHERHPESTMSEAEQVAIISDVLAQLTPDEIILLRDANEMPIDMLEAVYQCRPGTFRSRLLRLRKKLLDLIRRTGDHDEGAATPETETGDDQ